MERKQIRLRRDEILRTKFLKFEYHNIILKSIARTRTIKPIIRFFALLKIQKKNTYISRWKNFCLLTGRGKGVTRSFNISRHMLNKQGQQGYITGYTRNNFR